MMWSDWNLINVVCVMFSGGASVYFFGEGNNYGGWLNLFASSVNLAIVGAKLV